jgi:hypothetical protein
MTTTALAVELIVIGYQALIWIVLAVSLLPHCGDLPSVFLKDWKELLLVGSLVAAYTSGAIVNGVASKLMSKIEENLVFKRTEPPSEMRAAILLHQPEALKQVITYFDAPRVLRSTIFNILLIGVFTTIHVYRALSLCEILTIVACFIVVAATAAWAWYETDENYYVHLCQTYDALIRMRK